VAQTGSANLNRNPVAQTCTANLLRQQLSPGAKKAHSLALRVCIAENTF